MVIVRVDAMKDGDTMAVKAGSVKTMLDELKFALLKLLHSNKHMVAVVMTAVKITAEDTNSIKSNHQFLQHSSSCSGDSSLPHRSGLPP